MSRERAQKLASAAGSGDPVAWFERLYAESAGNAQEVPWADQEPHPLLQEWLRTADVRGLSTLVVGCGLGDDAAALGAAGAVVTAFDVSRTAVEWARRRFPDPAVDWQVADLLDPPAAWTGAFDLVVEVYTVQALRYGAREQAIRVLPTLVRPGGRLLVIDRVREDDEPDGDLPWPLTRSELAAMGSDLLLLDAQEVVDTEERSPVRRTRTVWRRPPVLACRLGLAPHPEGGWYRETWRSDLTLAAAALPAGYGGDRSAGTAVTYLLAAGESSAWHRVRSTELWLWQGGDAVTLRLGGSGPRPEPEEGVVIGPDADAGQVLQAVVGAGVWQAAAPATGADALVACLVVPGFDFADFELVPPPS